MTALLRIFVKARTYVLLPMLALAGCSAPQVKTQEQALPTVEELVADYAPQLCYLVAEQMQRNLKVAAATGTEFKGKLPEECNDGVPLADNAAWAARLDALRSQSAQQIEQKGHVELPRNVDVASSNACGVNRPLNGPGELRQSGSDILLAKSGAPEGIGAVGRVMENHVVFLMIGGPAGNDPFYSEPLFGDWSNNSLKLRGINPECVVVLTLRQ